jgi:hypothetical protein
MIGRAAVAPADPPIVGSRESLLMFVDQLPERAPSGQKKAARRQAAPARGRKGTRAAAPPASAAVAVAEAEQKLARLRTRRQVDA